MSKFFVGQRVRVVNAGKTCTNRIALALVGKTGRLQKRLDRPQWWYVDIAEGDWDTEAHEDALEPIVDQGLEACEEDFRLSLDELLERQREAA